MFSSSDLSSRRYLYLIPATVIATSSLTAYLYYSGRLRLRSTFPYVSCSLRRSFLRDSRPSPPKLGAPKSPLSLDSKSYPWVPRDNQCVEVKFGLELPDPYRWLEAPDSAQTAAFIEAQNILSTKIFEQCPSREDFKKFLTKVYDYAKYGCPHEEGGRFYFGFNSGLENQNSIRVHDGDFKQAKLFLDPNRWSEDGTIALTSSAFSKHAKYMGYTVSSGGSDWQKIKVLRVKDNGGYDELRDEIQFVKFSSITWTDDELGFFYCRYPDPELSHDEVLGRETQANSHHHVCYHILGTNQSDDVVVYQPPGKEDWQLHAELSDDGRYLLIGLFPGCKPGNEMAYLDLNQFPRHSNGVLDLTTASSRFIELVKGTEASYTYLANDGPLFSFLTNKEAPRYKVVQVELQDPKNWRDLIGQDERNTLEWGQAVKGDNLIVCYLQDVANVLEVRSLSTGEKKEEIKIPPLGSVTSFSGKRELPFVFFVYQSRKIPTQIYKYHVEEKKLEIVHSTKVPGLDPEDYQTERVFVDSYDKKVKIPLFITYKKGVELNGENPTLMSGYGGFNVSECPRFSLTSMAFAMAYNGIIATANIRGGGEYGIEWRNGGCLENKQNVFDDFHACAEYLIAHNYCDQSRLGITGGSNGGLLVAACANQRPDLYSCVVCHVGVLDMLRFHLFTIGSAWIPELGDPDLVSDFDYIFKYSPLHNIRIPEGGSRLYPSMLLTTGDQDDRVSPLHTFKFLAELQYVFGEGSGIEETNPLIARINTKAGHGAGKPTSMIIEEYTDALSFLATTLHARFQINSES